MAAEGVVGSESDPVFADPRHLQIGKALTALRASPGPRTMILRGGVHYLSSTIELTPADSGLTFSRRRPRHCVLTRRSATAAARAVTRPLAAALDQAPRHVHRVPTDGGLRRAAAALAAPRPAPPPPRAPPPPPPFSFYSRPHKHHPLPPSPFSPLFPLLPRPLAPSLPCSLVPLFLCSCPFLLPPTQTVAGTTQLPSPNRHNHEKFKSFSKLVRSVHVF